MTTDRAGRAQSLMTVAEVAAWLNVSKAWVRDHCTRSEPKLPYIKVGDLLRFRQQDLEEWIQKQQRRGAA